MLLEGLDEVVQADAPDFSDSGLKAPSVIRVGRLAVVEENALLGAMGEISKERLRRIKTRLAHWLAQS